MARTLVERHGGAVPRTRDELTALPGVGLKTANVVLGNAFDQQAIAWTPTSSASPSVCGSRAPRMPTRSTTKLVNVLPRGSGP